MGFPHPKCASAHVTKDTVPWMVKRKLVGKFVDNVWTDQDTVLLKLITEIKYKN